ncbi:unnamed protein product [Notodromas monacha]|nr:unnamed protein product [Notodromas monacha]CAG0915031.1 unnamed protein product [Notodromas monacha]
MLSFLLSCFFSRANLAAAAGGILFFVTYLPYPFMIVWDHSVLDWQRFIGSALSNVAFGFGCDVLAEWEELGVGAHWHNLFQSPDPFNTELSLGSQILALWVDAMLYFLAAVYIEGVFPGRYGVPLPWWYPFSLSYWSGDFVGKDNKFDAEPASPGNRKVNESDPVGLTKGVEMINLRKVYDDYDKIAVDNLNLSFYENQITAFLGHNGAGKTTTISILTGLLQPTAGTAKIYGQDIRTEMDSIRKSMGVCPQHNVLFHYMTVEEHLLFYAGLKGTLSDQEMDREVQDMIRDLGLPKKRHELSCNLSGGMQRKLSIAISFLAKSRTVFLDEPTAGVDPHSRRAIWKLLTKYKKGRTVILTTHHMDEAEILGDRIAIISCGALVCSGSALFLKKLYGSGYVLRVVLSENLGKNDEDVANDGETEKAAKKRIQHFLRQLYRGIRVAEEVGSEISFLLPWSKNSEEVVNAVGDSHESHENVRESHVKDVMRLQKLLEALDKRIDELPISSYGISDTKLEEIFLRVTSDADVGAPKKKRKSLLQLLLETYARGKTEIMTTLQSSPSIISATLPGNRRGSDASSVTPCCTPAYGDCVNRLLASARRRRNVVNTAEEPAKNSAAIDIPNVAREGNGEAKNEMNEEDGDGIEDEEDPSAPLSPKKISQPRIVRMTQDKQYKNLDGGKLLVTQFLAVEAKRYHHAKRDSRTLFCQLVLPVLFVTLAMMSTSIAPGIDVEDEYNYRELHHWHYHSSPVVFFSESDAWRASRAAAAANRTLEEQQARINVIDDDEAWFNEDLFGDEQQDVGNGVGRRGEKRFEDIFDILGADGTTGGAVTDPYLRSMLSPTGIGTRCVHEHYYFPCLRSIEYNVTDLAEPLNGTFPLGDCSCTNGGQYCPADASKPEPIGIQMPTSDFVVNITDRNPSQWIINTHQAMKLIRYGGYTFGMKAPGPFSDSPPWNVSSVGLLLAGAARAFNVTLGDELATRSLLLDKTLNHDEPDRVRGYNDTTRPYIKVWFFNKGWITSVAFMNAINNVILRTHLEAKFRMMNSSEDAILPDFREYGVAVVNHPISTDNAFQATIIKRSAFALLHSICVIYAMSFVPAAFVVYLIEDRISGSKHLQFVSGLPPWLYWISAYAWDMSSYLVSASLCVFVFLVFDEEAYVARDTFPGLLVLMVLYGWATVPLMYPFSFFFETSSFAFVALATANLFIGIVSTISTFVLEIMEEEEFQDIANVLKQVFLAFPQYCLGRGLMELAKFKVISSSVAMILDTEVKELDVFEWTFLGRNVASMIAQGFLGFAVTLLIQYRPKCGWWSLIRFNSCCVCFRIGNSMKIMLFRILRAASPTAFDKWRLDNELRVVSTRSEAGGKTESEDEDVARERREVLDGSGEATLKVVNLTKVYGKTDLTAVNGTCFAVRRGECFGLLGVNGAGKTTTFKMLTGDVSITSGDAFVDGFSVRNKLNKVRRRLGYCPQFDALDPLLTSREHLYLYARLRGLPSQQMESTVDSLLERMNLGYYADRKSETYSGGNKRKLSTAIALVGNPSLVFLDEPTSGMDAGARRFLWNCILDLAHKDKRCVILTSHSMEECETLCSRLAIMVSGSFRCIGSVQHLKNK